MKYNFIFEQTTIVTPSELRILNESKTSKGDPKVTFLSRLQEQDVLNNNKRKYSKLVCESIVSQLGPKAKNRNLLQEIDHPMFFPGSDSPENMKKRATIVEINNCGSVIRDLKIKNGQILGEIESLTGFKGPDLANLILNDRVNIGFSLRALGGVEPLSDGTLMVTTPILPITYDVVSNPSHSNARVMEFLPESDLSLLDNATSIMFEGQEIELLKEDNISTNNSNYSNAFIKQVIREDFMNVISKNIRFRF